MNDKLKPADIGEQPDYFAEDLKHCNDYERPYLENVAKLPHFFETDTYEKRMQYRAKMVERLKAYPYPPESLILIAAEFYARLETCEAALRELMAFIIENKEINPQRFRELFGVEVELLHKGARFQPKRKKGALSLETKHIYDLVKKNPALCVKSLRNLADKNIIGNMACGTFSNHVTKARKRYPKTRKPRK